MQRIGVVFTIVVMLGACGADSGPIAPPNPPPPGDSDVNMDPDWDPQLIAERPYSLKAPAGYDGSPTPLIVTLHGLGSNGVQQASLSGMLNLSDSRGFLLAYPDGKSVFGAQSWNASCCGALALATDDVTYLRAVIADASSQYNVDPKRVYVTGLSNGGFMSYVMACAAADRVAAVGPMSGTMWTADMPQCTPSEPVAVLHTHGTADPTVEYSGGYFAAGFTSVQYESVASVTAKWVALNGCNPTPQSRTFDAEQVLAGEETDIDRYTGCNGGATVELWTINNGEHVPQITAAYREALVDFFFAHPKP